MRRAPRPDGRPDPWGQALDRLLPMHLRFDAEGTVVHVAPTLAKMCGTAARPGIPVFDLVELRPGDIDDARALMALAGRRVALSLRAAPDLPMRGALAVLPEGNGAILDVSPGLSFARAVARFGLTMSDFSPCDQTVELLYLQEANAATRQLSRDLTERLSQARRAAERQALTDPLTGIANRRAMDAELDRILADDAAEVALLHLDLDLFKQVNDTHGHAAGDHVLRTVADILGSETRRDDLAVRIGGDEFLLIVRHTTDPAALTKLARRLIARIEQPLTFGDRLFRLSASVGLTATPAYAERPTADRLLADTDAALYRAKSSGRGRVVLHDAGAGERRRARGV